MLDEQKDAKIVYGHIERCAKSVDACVKLIEHCIAQTSSNAYAYRYIYDNIISADAPGLFAYHLRDGAQSAIDEKNPEKAREHIEASAMRMHTCAKEDLKFYELMMLLESDIELEKKGIVYAISEEEYKGREVRYSKKDRAYFADLPRVTWKSGSDFRTAAPYWFVWLDGHEIVHL